MTDRALPLLPLVLHAVPRGLRQALAQEGVPYRLHRPGPPQGRFVLYDGRTSPTLALHAGQAAIDVAPLRRAHREDPFEALVDLRSARFQWQIAGLNLAEEIARADKRAVRRQVLDGLRELLEQQGGVWMRMGAFPFPYRSALSFRIDYDDYEPRDFETTLDAVAGHEHATSHFVAAAGFQGAGDALARLRGLDVGSHGFWHHTYRTEEENLHNVRRGIDALEAAGLGPRGFAAPHGKFNRGLLAALESLGVPYSSEFALAYDELPFYPEGGDVLQIPVHPVCLGLFLDAVKRECRDRAGRAGDVAEAAVDGAVEYYRGLIESRYRTGEPAILYCHPTGRLGRYPRVLQAVFEAAGAYGGLWQTTMTGLYEWWQVRSKVHVTVTEQGDGYVVTTHRKPAGFRVGIELWRGPHVATLPLDRPRLRVSPGALAFEKRAPAPGVRPVRIDKPEGLRSRLRRLLDWERVTPVEEIPSGTLRNWAKRALRQFLSDEER